MTYRQQAESAIKADMRWIYKNRLIVYPLLCIISLFLVLVSSCEESFPTSKKYRVTFENQSGDTIYYVTHFCYPSYPAEKQDLDIEESDIVHILNNGERDEYLEIYSYPPQECLGVFVFKKDTWRKYGKEGLIENKIVDKRYVYNYEELQLMGFKITHTADSLSN